MKRLLLLGCASLALIIASAQARVMRMRACILGLDVGVQNLG